MPSKLLISQIKEETDIQKAIGYLADLIVECEDANREWQGKTCIKIDGIKEEIAGNGKIGLKKRVDKIEDRLNLIMWVLSVTSLAVLGYVIERILVTTLGGG